MDSITRYSGMAKGLVENSEFVSDVQVLLFNYKSAGDVSIHECCEFAEKTCYVPTYYSTTATANTRK